MKPKVAVFYDWLNQWGGAERVLLDILKIYPQADLFTLVHDPCRTPWLPKDHKVTTSFINQLPFSQHNPIFYTPLYALALEQFDFSPYDMVISTTSTIGHCLLTPPRTLFITYFHNLNRHLYSRPYLKFYQKIDQIFAHRPDAILCNSQTVSARIQHTYHLTPQVINPGIDTNYFHPHIPYLPAVEGTNPKSPYFLVVSRLVKHKRIDIVIEAFKKLPYRLIIVGTGREESTLKNLAYNSSNINFIGSISNSELLNYYQHCQALICPQLEDFGLTALEAQACGKPVIAYGRGGNTETIINQKTGLFFNHQTPPCLTQAITKFYKLKFNQKIIRQHAQKFSHSRFMLHFKQTVDRLWQQHLTTMF